MLKLNFFASVREAAGRRNSEMDLPKSVTDVAGLIKYLSEVDNLTLLADEGRVLVAVNHCIVDRDYPLAGNEEVAFFPPMTGG